MIDTTTDDLSSPTRYRITPKMLDSRVQMRAVWLQMLEDSRWNHNEQLKQNAIILSLMYRLAASDLEKWVRSRQ